jgi:hypothetical protein
MTKLPEKEVERTRRALDRNAGNVTRTALALNISRSSLQSRLKRMGIHTDPKAEVEPAEIRKLIALQDENAKLRKQLTDAHRNALDDEAIHEILGGIVARPPNPPDWLTRTTAKNGRTPEVPVTIWSDWHAGEVVSLTETNGVNEFNKEIFERWHQLKAELKAIENRMQPLERTDEVH